MAINFLNTVAVDDSVLFVDTINDRVGIGTASLVTKLEVSTGLGTGSDGVFIKDPFAGTSRTANSKNPMLSLGTSTENGSAATIFMGANATPTNQDSKIEFNRTGGYLSIWYKGQGTYREHVRYGNPASSTPRSAFFGNVGIGTITPGVALDVNGEIAIRGGEGVDDARMYFRASDNSNRFTIETDLDGSTSNDLLGFRAVSADNILVLKGNGNVGIGTASPNSPLDIRRTSDGIALELISTVGDADEFVDLKMISGNTTAGTLGTILRHKRDGTGGGDFSILTNPTLTGTPTEKLTVKSNGNVGIGTASPTAKLQVDGDIDTISGDGYLINGMAWAYEASSLLSLGNWDGNNFETRIMDENSNEVLRVAGGGVGVGTTSPGTKLHVSGDGALNATSTQSLLRLERPFNGGVSYAQGADIAIGRGNTYPSTQMRFILDNGTNNGTNPQATVMALDSSGNVGIGTTSPGYKLEVNAGNGIFVGDGGVPVLEADSSTGIFKIGDTDELGDGIYATNTGTSYFDIYSAGSIKFRMNSAGNVGIGTISPEATLSVVGATSTNNLIGGSINLATSSGWVIPSGAMSTRVGYYGGDFTLNGAVAENGMEWGLGPFNDRQLLWTTTGSTDSNQDGGWNKTLTNLDIESPYLSVVYFKRVSSNSSGNFYHGTGNNILNLDGTSNVNPYFTVRALSGFDQNVWYASVGVIQSNSDSNTTAYADVSGLYRLDTGVKVANSNAFKFASTGATLTRGHRTYLYYSTDTSVVAQFANPGFYKIDGDQPKLHDIVGGDSDDVFWSANGNDIYNDNSGNVGIGTTSPVNDLHISSATGSARLTSTAGGANVFMESADNNITRIRWSSNSKFALRNDTTATDVVTINQSDYVGIRNTDPSFPLSVNGTSAANRFYVPNVTATTAWAFQARNSGNTADSGLYFENGDAQLLLRDDDNNLNVRINADTNSYINGGSLGLGTTSPNLKLDVISGTNNGIRISATDTTSNWRDIDIRSYVSQAQANALPDGSAIYTTNPASQTETAFSKFGGLVLQGRDDGNSSFAIRLGNGNGYATRMFMGATGATVFSNTVTATNFILSSDKRLKENIEKVCDNRVKVDWKTFELKTEKGQKRYGVIAQELEENHPEFVKTDDEGFKSVKYIDLLIAKIAELEARLEKLEK